MPAAGPLGQALRASRLAVTSELREEQRKLTQTQAELRGRERELQDAKTRLQTTQAEAAESAQSAQQVSESEAALRCELFRTRTDVFREAGQQREAVEVARTELRAQTSELQWAQGQLEVARASATASTSREEEMQAQCRCLAESEVAMQANLEDLERVRARFCLLEVREEELTNQLESAQSQLATREERMTFQAELTEAQAGAQAELVSALAEAEASRAREDKLASERRDLAENVEALRDELAAERARKGKGEKEEEAMKRCSPWHKATKRSSSRRRLMYPFGLLRTVTGPRTGSVGASKRRSSRRARKGSVERLAKDEEVSGQSSTSAVAENLAAL